jgi:hypothetical protein
LGICISIKTREETVSARKLFFSAVAKKEKENVSLSGAGFVAVQSEQPDLCFINYLF